MKKLFLFFIVLFSFEACSRVRINPFVLTKRLNPNYEEIKIFWSDDISEVTFNEQVINKQGVYYLVPKIYDLTWKYKIIKDHETVYKWKFEKIDLSDAKEIHFEKGKVTKK